MIKGDFLQLAQEYDMKQDQGVAYGIVEGYAATFIDGAGTHRMMLTTRFESNLDKDALMEIVNKVDLKGVYNIRKLQIAKKVIYVAFAMAPDAMEKIRSFIAWFFPLLEQFGASKADICVQCQEPIAEEDVQWVLRDGATAFRMHKACAEDLKLTVAVQNKGHRATADGSLLMGTLGALLGAVVGALLWLLLQTINFYTPIAGMAIGWTAFTGYNLLQGRSGKLRIPIVLLCGIFGVFFSLFLCSVVPLLKQFGLGSFQTFFQLFVGSADYRGTFMGTAILGVLFLLLGLFVSAKSEGRRTTDMVVTDLN